MLTPRARQGLLLLIATTMALLVGCERKPPAPAPVALASMPAIVLNTPEDTTRSVLLCLQARLRAVARHDERSAELHLEQLQKLAATTMIEEAFARMPPLKAVVGDDLIEGLVNMWGAAIAYYADGLQLERVRRTSTAPSKVSVVVPASGPDDDALIQVTCVREDDDRWRVSRIEFVAETPTSQPVPPPVSQPASPPS